MDHAEFARRMTETDEQVRRTQALIHSLVPRLEQAQPDFARTLRFVTWAQRFALVVSGLSLLFMSYVIWHEVSTYPEHAAQTQALLALVRRLQP